MAGNINELTVENFDSFIQKGDSIVDFYTDWCAPCKTMEPEFKEASEKIENVQFGKLNVDGNQDIAMRYGVMSVPTTIFFKNQDQVDRHTGALTFEDIEEKSKAVFG